MKVLLDACVWGGAMSVLRSAGHDVEWVGDWSADPGDEQILATAAAQEQVLVTARQGLRRVGRLASTSACWNRATRELACARSGTCVYCCSPSLRCGTRAGRHRDRRGPTRAYPPAGRQATIGRGERSGSRYCIQSVMSCRRRSNRSLLAYAASVWLRTTCASAASTTSRG